jgi:hypothetical protein
MRRITMLVVCTLALALCAGFAAAATTPPPADTLKVDYFANANTAGAPDATAAVFAPLSTCLTSTRKCRNAAVATSVPMVCGHSP